MASDSERDATSPPAPGKAASTIPSNEQPTPGKLVEKADDDDDDDDDVVTSRKRGARANGVADEEEEAEDGDLFGDEPDEDAQDTKPYGDSAFSQVHGD